MAETCFGFIEDRIISSRIFAFPRDVVFDAFADPAKLAQWWGPAGFRNTFKTFEFRPGGMWIFTMHGPDGTDYANESEFVEITRPERIVFIHHRTMHHFRMTQTFAEEAGGTRLTWSMQFDSPEETEKCRVFVVPANEQNFDRLEVVLRSS